MERGLEPTAMEVNIQSLEFTVHPNRQWPTVPVGCTISVNDLTVEANVLQRIAMCVSTKIHPVECEHSLSFQHFGLGLKVTTNTSVRPVWFSD